MKNGRRCRDLDVAGKRFIVLPATALMFLIGICPQMVLDQCDQHDGHANGGPIEILTKNRCCPVTIYITFIGVLALMLLPGGNPRTAQLRSPW